MQKNDIVEDLEKYSNILEWSFSYGNKANQNLLQSELEENKIYFILDPVTRLRKFSQLGGTGATSFTGSFLLVVKSTIDQTYYNQTKEEIFSNRVASLEGGFTVENKCLDTNYKAGKYIQNIKPLLNVELPRLEDILNCSDYEITSWSIIDVVDAFDVNTDGIVVNFNLSIL